MFKICIDPGHGGTDPGAVGSYSKEKDLNLLYAKGLRQLLIDDDRFEISMTREDDTYLKLSKRVLKATEEDVDVFVSIHCNSFTSDRPNDCQAYYYNKETDKVLADLIFAYIDRVDDKTSKWSRVDFGNFYVLRKLNNYPTASCLIEIGFISNEEDEELLNDDTFQLRFVNAVYHGIKAYFNI